MLKIKSKKSWGHLGGSKSLGPCPKTTKGEEEAQCEREDDCGPHCLGTRRGWRFRCPRCRSQAGSSPEVLARPLHSPGIASRPRRVRRSQRRQRPGREEDPERRGQREGRRRRAQAGRALHGPGPLRWGTQPPHVRNTWAPAVGQGLARAPWHWVCGQNSS